MGPSGNKQGGFKFMTLGSMKKMNRWSWDEIPIPDTIIAQLNALDQGEPNDLQLCDSKKRPIKEIDIKRVDDGGNEALKI